MLDMQAFQPLTVDACIYTISSLRRDRSLREVGSTTLFCVKNMIHRGLEEILQSTSDVLFPAELGEAKVYIDSVDVDGDTPLHVLIWRKDTEGAIKLIENGAPPNAPGDMGETPLHIAILQNEIEIIKALLKAGARTDIVSVFGKTAMDRATEQGINLSAFLESV